MRVILATLLMVASLSLLTAAHRAPMYCEHSKTDASDVMRVSECVEGPAGFWTIVTHNTGFDDVNHNTGFDDVNHTMHDHHNLNDVHERSDSDNGPSNPTSPGPGPQPVGPGPGPQPVGPGPGSQPVGPLAEQQRQVGAATGLMRDTI
ncbi:hypothetical protein T484DRAFT_1858288 [Baffinella frigidus]|nr:hypothetical protein T484DRAFT_1858288 [Cryptophyta sp. CCMP2293]